jgi:glycine/D-amino acid oxidase-like deaminating enzyme
LILLAGDPSGWPRPWPGVELLTGERVAELAPDLAPVPGALLARDQAQAHPLRLAAELARRAGSVATGVAMTGLDTAGGRVVMVRTTEGDLHPGNVVLATGLAPAPWVRLPQRLVKGHLVATEPGGFRLGCGVHVPGPGVGLMADRGLLAGGTRDEGDQSPEVRTEVVESIRRRLAELVPAARTARLRHAWCCFRPSHCGWPADDRPGPRAC